MRLLNANSLQISERISVAYGCMRCGVAFGLPVSCDWSMDEFFCSVSAIGQSTLFILLTSFLRNTMAYVPLLSVLENVNLQMQ